MFFYLVVSLKQEKMWNNKLTLNYIKETLKQLIIFIQFIMKKINAYVDNNIAKKYWTLKTLLTWNVVSFWETKVFLCQCVSFPHKKYHIDTIKYPLAFYNNISYFDTIWYNL